MAGSVNVNAGGYGNDAHGPESLDYGASEPITEGELGGSVEPLGWVDAPTQPEIGPPRVPRLPRQIRVARSGSAYPVKSPESDLGPCLYFGPAGQRCDRRALEGGFCSKHQFASQLGGSPSLSGQQISKRVLGVAGILAVLWPILADVIREIVRLFR